MSLSQRPLTRSSHPLMALGSVGMGESLALARCPDSRGPPARPQSSSTTEAKSKVNQWGVASLVSRPLSKLSPPTDAA